MKKIYLVLGIMSVCLYSTGQQSATVRYVSTITEVENIQPQVMMKKNGDYVKGYINNIPSIILADFTRRYEDPLIASWYIDDSRVTGYFNHDNEAVIVSYKKNGYLLAVQKTYDSTGAEMPLLAVLRNDLKKGYHISLVTEIIHEDATFYRVNLVSNEDICIVSLSQKKGENPVISDRAYH